ncbi:NAD-dependent protein deacetylase sirtuin-1 [Cephus cinctus]|uniref:protein acetyllysine N-acetyltransferase n=1 Tax=Cephus cinctus TaxID=211228 RepID=A0AAJ7BN31_CEPCN|nr:NAD-dependent protein deacetylase sirtuin-1 [Cephus cinctus]
MASRSELPEYSSPAKRRKVDCDEYGTSSGAELDFVDREASRESPDEDLEETLGGDSGFNELSDGSKSVPNTPDVTNLTSTPTRTDSTSDDTGCSLDTADEKDEVSSTVSNLSELSGLSDLSGETEGHQWRASAWVHKQMLTGANPRDLLNHLLMDSQPIPEVDDITLWKIIVNVMTDQPRRQKLRHVNTLTDVVRLIKNSKKIIVLTGAGVSVSCGIPDFRSRDGIYSRLAQDFPDLPDPQAMFDINYFGQDPRPFYKFAREIYPGQFKPSPCHRFIKMLDKHKKLLRNYSQNIDTLEQVAGIENVIECHGSFATASCTKCKYQVRADDIREDIFAQKIPMCPKCRANALPSIAVGNPNESYRDLVSQGIMKPDIVFFGEGLPDAFHDAMAKDKDDCDLLIVIGSSLKVRPVALIPSSIPSHVPQILINRESLPHLKFDVELLGDGDVIINQLCHLMGNSFNEICWADDILKEASQLLPSRFTADDSWEQSQDTMTNHEFSQDSVEVNLKSHHLSTESQDSLMINANTTPKRMESTDICISPFHAGHMESTVEGSFALLGESPKRRLGDSSAESSPKRMHFGSSPGTELVDTPTSQGLENSEVKGDSISRNNRVISVESTSENNGQILNLEECHVVPRMMNLHSRDSGIEIIQESETSSPGITTFRKNVNSAMHDGILVGDCDKSGLKPRHVSIDSALDSGIGDSCNSIDSTDGKTNADNNDVSKIHDLERRCWQPKLKESLAKRLPENSYYQMTPGRYIFPGAEIYSDLDDYDRCSLSANSDSSDSDSDTSSEEEEETCADEEFSEEVDADAEADGEEVDWASNPSNEIQR